MRDRRPASCYAPRLAAAVFGVWVLFGCSEYAWPLPDDPRPDGGAAPARDASARVDADAMPELPSPVEDASMGPRPEDGGLSDAGRGVDPIGAALLEPDPETSEAGLPLAHYASITPALEIAPDDLPTAYALGCQARADSVKPRWCEAGDLASDVRIVLVGDSKLLQYYDALDAVGKALGLRIVSATKSACPFSAAGVDWQGAPYTECDAFNAAVLEQLTADPPSAVLTSQLALIGYAPGTYITRTQEDMVAGLVSRWSDVLALGTKVVVLLDNPRPPWGPSVYQCLLDNPEQHDLCAFPRDEAVARSAAVVQRAAAEMLPGVGVVDLTSYLCPQSLCAPVIGGVLVYRNGSHVTNTYAVTLTGRLQIELEAALR